MGTLFTLAPPVQPPWLLGPPVWSNPGALGPTVPANGVIGGPRGSGGQGVRWVDEMGWIIIMDNGVRGWVRRS